MSIILHPGRHSIDCPPIPKDDTDDGARVPIIRGESELISYRRDGGPTRDELLCRRSWRWPTRARFVAWWCSHASDATEGWSPSGRLDR